MAKANEVAMPNLRLRKNAMWSEQFQHQSKSITRNTPDQQPYWLQSQCNLRSSHEMSSTSIMRNYKSNRGSKITWCLVAYYIWGVTALPYQHRISSRDLSMEKLGILRTEMIFTLPRCLLLRVMCPMHLQELDGLVASLALRRVKNTDWTLRVRKIRTQLDLAQVHCLLRLLETLLQLGHVEHIMHHSQAIWKLEAERERSSSLKKTERTNEPGSQLAFGPKTVSAPKW